jgi:hypothetical protein
MARPSIYSDDLAASICARLAAGESLRRICADDAMPCRDTVFAWVSTNPQFSDQYAKARQFQMEAMAEDILEIADDGTNDTYTDDEGRTRVDSDVIARSRLRVDTRKWLMSKLAPKKYGDRVSQEISGPDGGPMQIDRIERVVIGGNA